MILNFCIFACEGQSEQTCEAAFGKIKAMKQAFLFYLFLSSKKY
jgi:hypothetical protein